jgi:hypothetical protein
VPAGGIMAARAQLKEEFGTSKGQLLLGYAAYTL